MKQAVVLVAGFVALVAAKCCRKDQCLREIVANGREDCSAYLTPITITTTEDAPTYYSTIGEPISTFTTEVESHFITVTSTTTASTETILSTIETSSTVTTEILVSLTTEAVVASTETLISTTTTTTTQEAPAFRLKFRDDEPLGLLPEYATAICTSYATYASACKCAGVTPSTVTVSASVEPTIIIVTSTTPVLSTITSTATITSTHIESLTSTTSTTTTEIDLLTATSTTTSTDIISITTTTTTSAIATETAGTCLKGAALGPFKANYSGWNDSTLSIYANLLNGLTGGIIWQRPSTSTSAAVQNKYIWALDEQGRLKVASNIPPYTYKYYAYMSTTSPGSNWPQIGTEASVASSINGGAAVAYITGCVDSVTGELTLNAAGRTNILYCGQQLWMSYGMGEDINRGGCVRFTPTVVRV